MDGRIAAKIDVVHRHSKQETHAECKPGRRGKNPEPLSNGGR